MRINCYGERADGSLDAKGLARDPCGVKKVAGATYLRFAPRSPAPIHRLSVSADGIVRHDWAWGMWADVKSLAYVPLETTLEVQE